MEFQKDPSAVALELLLIVQPEKRKTVQKLQIDKQTESHASLQSQGFEGDGNGNNKLQQYQGNDPHGHETQMQQVISSCSEQGTHVTVEVHARNSTPQLFKKLSFGKGFQENGKRRPRPPGSKDQHAYPWDKSCLKSMPLDLKQFEKLDAYATKVIAKSSVEELVKTLLRVAHTDLEKVRAIWTWICHHIEYDVVGFYNKDKQSFKPKDVLQSGKSICEGYAGLFEQMCSIAGVQCMNLSGYSKGHGYRAGQTFTGEYDHAWNAVYLDGRWHLVDSTWGSGSMDDCFSKFTFRYNEFYFLTHPALFINNHFPDNSNWQLLKSTVTLKQFESNMLYKSDFYKMGLLAAHPETPIIQTVNGKVAVAVESRSPMLFMFELKGAKEFSLMTLKRNGMNLELYPQKTGSHKLQIYAKPSKGSEEIYNCILEYTLECSSVDRTICFPKELHQPVGPSWFTERQGFLKPSHRHSIIHTNDGRCDLSFILSKDLSILASLHSDNISLTEDTRRRHVLQVCQGNQIKFKIHLPHAGNFAFKIFAKKKSDPGNYNYVFNYLISCPNTEVKWPMFPQNYSKWAEGYELVEPLAGLLPANRYIRFKLKLHSIAKAFVQCEKTCPLSLSKDGYWEGSCNTSGCTEVFVMVLENANHKFYSHILKYEVEPQ
ncbi:kyphoscoliosis peptidase isoform X2 [Hemicordylus capensis]|uniref:kyphoscoliosis peptidase isoform X2 n=1 Tax=Hemicordylus capensis TaxID=884348 RepID=UPI0023043ADC|nr:kyphoscoliosis peptidase isoform X2 [Hemicordylus capensis]